MAYSTRWASTCLLSQLISAYVQGEHEGMTMQSHICAIADVRTVPQETDRGRHDKYSTGKRGLYSVDWSEIEQAAQFYSDGSSNNGISPTTRPVT